MSNYIEQVGKSKLYFSNYLPGSIVRLRNNSFAKVTGTRSNDREKDSISKEQLLEVAAQFIQDWDAYEDASVDLGLSDAIAKNEVIIDSPNAIYVSPYPYILRCNNESCGRVLNYKGKKESQRRKDLEKLTMKKGKSRYIRCPERGCHGHMLQLGLSAIHRCGNIQDINFGYQAYGHDLAIRELHAIPYTTSLIDIHTGKAISKLYQPDCPSCKNAYPDLRNINQRITRSSAGDTFYSQNIQYIALKQKNSRLVQKLRNNPGISEDVISGLLLSLIGKIKPKERYDEFNNLLNGTGLDEVQISAIKKELDAILAGLKELRENKDNMTESLYQLMAGNLEEKEQKLTEKLRRSEGAFPEVNDYIFNKTHQDY